MFKKKNEIFIANQFDMSMDKHIFSFHFTSIIIICTTI